MDDVGVVRRFERVGDLTREVEQDVRRQRTRLQTFGKRFTVQILHHDEVDGVIGVQLLFAEVVQHADMGM